MSRTIPLLVPALVVSICLTGCDDKEKEKAAAAASASAAAAAASASAAAAAAAAATASAAPSASAASSASLTPRSDCPKGSAGPGTFEHPCEAKGTSRMMEVK